MTMRLHLRRWAAYVAGMELRDRLTRPSSLRFDLGAAWDRGQPWLVYSGDVDARGAGSDVRGHRCGDLRRRQHMRFTAVGVHFRRHDHGHPDGDRRHGDSGDTESDPRDRGFVVVHGYSPHFVLAALSLTFDDSETSVRTRLT